MRGTLAILSLSHVEPVCPGPTIINDMSLYSISSARWSKSLEESHQVTFGRQASDRLCAWKAAGGVDAYTLSPSAVALGSGSGGTECRARSISEGNLQATFRPAYAFPRNGPMRRGFGTLSSQSAVCPSNRGNSTLRA